ncbi:hypothetical protein [Marinifilum fragile]|uniref:YobI family P-loop NTPase n=1 Tax=Marinifilum fragile TaxID=570161 RepID=UPI002AA7915E|nr:hypothetical protein [Marinifilum fragile]
MHKKIIPLIESTVNSLLKIKNRLELKTVQSNKYHFEDLAPIDNVNDKSYCEALSWALANKKIKNIAITGLYGSGKSSILQTFFKNHPIYKYLNISLATFRDIEEDSDKDDAINRLIEQSILQQIFYKEKSKKIPDSRFKKINKWKSPVLYFNSFLILIWISSSILLFNPGFLKNISIWHNSQLKYNTIFSYAVACIFFLGLLILIAKSIRLLKNSKFHKVNFKSGEIELGDRNDVSILNKHLDEILYFFEARKYNVVVFEDLDRFRNKEIFTKLREINLLINSSKQINRRIVFIYAIKDDMFKDKARTKFFDFIVPIIPVITSTNSEQLLLDKLKESDNENLLSDSFIRDISLYIDDMRVLKNIYNEFILYKNKLATVDLNQEKLFSFIIYKNLYPDDFAELHQDKGIIYEVFENKPNLQNKLYLNIDDKLDKLYCNLENIQNDNITNIKELRNLYIGHLLQILSAVEVYGIQLNDEKVSINEISTDSNFNSFQKLKNITYWHSNYGTTSYDLAFTTLEKKVDPKNTYKEREQIIKNKEKFKEGQIQKEIDALLVRKKNLISLTFENLIKKVTNEDAFHEKIRNEKVLVFLIRNGYIDETYSDFISFFYEGKLSKEDKNFLRSIKDLSPLEFTHKISNLEELTVRIYAHEYREKACLNFDLLNHILNNKEIFHVELEYFISQLTNESTESINFIEEYTSIENNKNIPQFIEILTHSWQDIWKFIIQNSSNYFNDKNKYLKLILKHSTKRDILHIDTYSDDGINNYLSRLENYSAFLLNEEDNSNWIHDVLESLFVKFKMIEKRRLAPNLFDFIYEKNLYEINFENIKTILSEKSDLTNFDLKLNESNLSTILESNCTILISYIKNEIEQYIENVFLTTETNTNESESTLNYLINQNNISFDDKKKIINQTNTKTNDLDSIPSDLWDFVLENNKVFPNWANVNFYYIEKEEINGSLIQFLNNQDNYSQLSKLKIDQEISDEENYNLSKAIMLCENISIDSYNSLILSFSLQFTDISFDVLSEEKVDTLVHNSILALDEYNSEILKETFPKLYAKLLIVNKEDFLNKLGQYSLNILDFTILLISEELTNFEKIKIINHQDYEDISIMESTANRILQILGKPDFELDHLLMKELVKNTSDVEKIIELINTQIEYLDNEEIVEYLTLLPKPYSNLTKGNPVIIDKEYTDEFLQHLKTRKLISSFRADKKGLRAFKRQKGYR